MAIPPFSDFHQPILKYLYDKNEATQRELMDVMADYFSLSESDIRETISNGSSRLYNRVSWARSYLKDAGLTNNAERGKTCITEEGRRVFESGKVIDTKYLTELKKNLGSDVTEEIKEKADSEEDCQITPEESLYAAIKQMNSKLESDILDEIMNQTPEFFENLVTDLLAEMYGGQFEENSEVTGRTGDGGIDGIIKKDRLGFDNIYVQAKRWENSVDRTEIQKFSGALDGQNATNGAFITTSDFSSGAKDYAKRLHGKRIVLINGKELAKLMIEYGVGLSSKTVIDIKKIDYNYFNPDI